MDWIPVQKLRDLVPCKQEILSRKRLANLRLLPLLSTSKMVLSVSILPRSVFWGEPCMQMISNKLHLGFFKKESTNFIATLDRALLKLCILLFKDLNT